MAASPVLLNPSQISPSRGVRIQWVPVLLGLAFICFTSTTFMGGSHTQLVLNAGWRAAFGSVDFNATGQLNEILRKSGHFVGYGLISLLFRNAWDKSLHATSWVLKSRLAAIAATLAVISTFGVACLDEWHQTFLPGRVGCLRDALLDAAGAVFLNVLFWAVSARRRKDMLVAW